MVHKQLVAQTRELGDIRILPFSALLRRRVADLRQFMLLLVADGSSVIARTVEDEVLEKSILRRPFDRRLLERAIGLRRREIRHHARLRVAADYVSFPTRIKRCARLRIAD